MKTTEFDCDKGLTEFLTDYLDGCLSRAECQSFEEYLANNKDERVFAQKAMKGKRALNYLAERINDPSVTA